MVKTIEFVEEEQCVGCTACKNICPGKCISMVKNLEGFSVPKINSADCFHCGKCYETCPVINVKERRVKPVILGMINKCAEIRNESSSGGVFYELARAIISEGGIVCAASLSEENITVKHVFIDRVEEIGLCTKSKYVESDLQDVYIRIQAYLKKGKKVLFVGTPCQVYGLSVFLDRDYENLFLVDLFCHGVPSPAVWDEFIDYMQQKYNSRISAVSFRDMSISGWKNFGMRILFENGAEYVDTQDKNPFMFGFLEGYINRQCCYKCRFKKRNRKSDLTLGDFWSVDKYIDKFNDNRGTSLVLVNSKKGVKLIKSVRTSFYIKRESSTDIGKINSAYSMSVSNIKNREYFFKKFLKGMKSVNILIIEMKKVR